ncbi:hypothetical protein WN944_014796 [Citrus x changshan-huyou]|uniref:UPF3 domain-containing protein n=1 Tax=Citrus x changshan-huyou TaxID=2935761 RepID=A0AAP0M7L0_9ROSI
MKKPLQRTKVVIRHLPPSLSQNDLLALFHDHFNDHYNWFYFRPGKSSYKDQMYSRAYEELKKHVNVFEFVELLNGHVFVNEKDSDYLEFLKVIAKLAENLPSAEIQMERKEVELSC